MTIDELKAECERMIAGGGDVVILTVPHTSRGYYQRLCGKHGPRGEIVCVNNEARAVCRFKASAVLKFLATNPASADERTR